MKIILELIIILKGDKLNEKQENVVQWVDNNGENL